MKLEALIFGLACFSVPGYAIYAAAIDNQSAMHHASTLDSGEMFVNSDTALMRVRFCELAFDPGTGEPIPSLIGVTNLTLEPDNLGPQFVCGLDGTTKRQRFGELAEAAAVDSKDLKRFHNILRTRGLMTDEQLEGFHHDSD